MPILLDTLSRNLILWNQLEPQVCFWCICFFYHSFSPIGFVSLNILTIISLSSKNVFFTQAWIWVWDQLYQRSLHHWSHCLVRTSFLHFFLILILASSHFLEKRIPKSNSFFFFLPWVHSVFMNLAFLCFNPTNGDILVFWLVFWHAYLLIPRKKIQFFLRENMFLGRFCNICYWIMTTQELDSFLSLIILIIMIIFYLCYFQ